MKLRTVLFLSIAAFVVLALGFFLLSPRHSDKEPRNLFEPAFWQGMAAPGELSKPHAFLDNNCAACHTAVKGVEAKNCIVCHADNKTVLQRQPSAFHADIAECSACHLEHRGRIPSTTQMDHVALARIGLRQFQSASPPQDEAGAALSAWLKQKDDPVPSSHLQREELMLNCARCHQSKDPHSGLFGTDCASCHGTSKWTIPEFRHPPASSQACAECHQAPPSHYMMHFEMISKRVAGVEHADVRQCFLCHQTTSWNDIRGVGTYKHH